MFKTALCDMNRGYYTPQLAWASARALLLLWLLKAQPNSPIPFLFFKKKGQNCVIFSGVKITLFSFSSFKIVTRLSLSSLCLCFTFISFNSEQQRLSLSQLSVSSLLLLFLLSSLHSPPPSLFYVFFYLFYFIAACLLFVNG